MTMSEMSFGIRCVNVRKSYPLYAGALEMALDRFGFSTLARLRRGAPIPRFEALRGINLTVGKGERIGVVGRNGAGKTTLLKLITGNFMPTAGQIDVNGKIQTLMNTGLGFHPEFTGYENLKSALQYNELTNAEYEAALAESVEFVELGEFLHQPVNTYSLGMRTRLQFAAATAIKPDILIVDEVLGAGDAYFGGKSSRRVKALTGSGCTLLLVSHSMQQVLQFCQRVIWIEAGQIVMEGEALPVVRAYEEFSRRLDNEAAVSEEHGVLNDEVLRHQLIDMVTARASSQASAGGELDTTNVSRWPGEEGLKIALLRLIDGEGKPAAAVRCGETAKIELELVRSSEEVRAFLPVVVVYGEDGRLYNRHVGEMVECLSESRRLTVKLEMTQLLLGGGRYVLSAAVYKNLDLVDSANSVAYDLISRCFEFEVLPKMPGDEALFMHPSIWNIVLSDVQ